MAKLFFSFLLVSASYCQADWTAPTWNAGNWLASCRASMSSAFRFIASYQKSDFTEVELHWLGRFTSSRGRLPMSLAMVGDEALSHLEHMGIVQMNCIRCELYKTDGYVVLTHKGRRLVDHLFPR